MKNCHFGLDVDTYQTKWTIFDLFGYFNHWQHCYFTE